MPENVKLWKGLFSDSLPGFIKEMDAAHPNGRFMISYLHVDCDLYVGGCYSAPNLQFWLHPRRSIVTMHLMTFAVHHLHVRFAHMSPIPANLLCFATHSVRLAGSKDVLTMLEDRILPGAIVVFDEVRGFVTECRDVVLDMCWTHISHG